VMWVIPLGKTCPQVHTECQSGRSCCQMCRNWHRRGDAFGCSHSQWPVTDGTAECVNTPNMSAERAVSLISLEVESLCRVVVIKVAVESWVCAGRRVISVRKEIYWCALFPC